MRAFSNGGGVQSTAALVLSAQGKIDFSTHLFANVGDDSENPDTLAYVRDIAMPYAEEHNIEFHEVQRRGKTLLQHIETAQRSIDIPMRFAHGRPGHRNCTSTYKIEVIHKALARASMSQGWASASMRWSGCAVAADLRMW